MKKTVIFALALAAILLMIAPADGLAAEKDFPDIQVHWAREYVLALAEKGGISGMPDGKFHPEDTVTLPQFVKIIIGCEYGDIAPFDGGDWASGYLQKALEVGIIDYMDLSNAGAISRYDAARIVAASLIYIYEEEEASDTTAVEIFEDYPSCKSCRSEFDMTVGQCYMKGIITGKPGPIFDGEGNLTRAEASIMIMKMIDPALRTPVEERREQDAES